jgi:hypothetical protein
MASSQAWQKFSPSFVLISSPQRLQNFMGNLAPGRFWAMKSACSCEVGKQRSQQYEYHHAKPSPSHWKRPSNSQQTVAKPSSLVALPIQT